ncbi:uncharacterized protein LOC121995470 [Zingiber officinale]|uniref:uncharacterized protein LOC121995470 n=1 Tax=Zingiber officinale TaxID=94328 RepID=UPI001C4BCC9A|nr:uncharacterized protein LOC121995470 [Zingiber officinale]
MTAGEYELFKEVKKRVASEKQGTVSRPRLAPETSKEPAPVSGRGSKRKQPEELSRASFREPRRNYHQPGPREREHSPKKEDPPVSVAESSLHPLRDSRKRKAIISAKDLPEDPDDKVPFSVQILRESLPRGYRAPNIGEYDGSKDPEEHLRKFKNAVMLYQYSDAVKYRVFLHTLSGLAQKWFDGLPPGSINHFLDFKTVFLRRFASSRKYQKTDHCLFALKQGPIEPLRSYINRFSQVANDVPSATSEILMSTFSHGLLEGEFFRDLIKNPARNFDDMVEKASCYIKVEEAQAARRKAEKTVAPSNRPERRAPQLAQPLQRVQPRPVLQPAQGVRPAPRVAAIHAPRPGPRGAPYCTYHWSRTHDISNCFQFACDSRRAVEQGLPPPELAPQIQRMEEERAAAGRARPNLTGPSNQAGPVGDQRDVGEMENRGNTAVREIGMISGGPTDGDSGRARKSHGRRLYVGAVGCSHEQASSPVINFGPQDLEGLELPHNDALIIKVVIANSRVARVFVDTGSSVNILFRAAFEEMQIDAAEL